MSRKAGGRDWSLKGWDWREEVAGKLPWRKLAIVGGAAVGALVVLSLFRPKRALRRMGRSSWGDYYDTRKRTLEIPVESMDSIITNKRT